jgi:hypothetical protein
MRLPRPAVVGEVSVEVSVFLKILEISFHQGMKLLHLGQEEMFALHRPIDNLVEVAGGSASLLGGGIARRELGCRRSLGR